MTYGWAILVVMAVGITMWQMGVINPDVGTQNGKRGFSQVSILDWRMAQTPDNKWNLTVILQNNAGSLIDIGGSAQGSGVTILDGGTGVCGDGVVEPGGPFPIQNIRPAQTLKMSFGGCQMNADLRTGDYYRVNVTIQYVNPKSGLPHLSNGVLWGPAG